VVARGYDHLLEGVLIGGVDVAWMPPLLHIEAVARGALLAAVTERGGAAAYRSAVLVRSPSLATSASRAALRAAWVDRSSASGYIYPRLRCDAPDRPFTLTSEAFFGSFETALRALAEGLADVSACYTPLEAKLGEETLHQIERSVGVILPAVTVWALTDPIPPDGMVLSASSIDQMAVRDALLQLHTLPRGREALRDLLGADRLVPVRREHTELIAAAARK
jgi:ABC-type phosphate/phosphonate transport system substrate-binding protein